MYSLCSKIILSNVIVMLDFSATETGAYTLYICYLCTASLRIDRLSVYLGREWIAIATSEYISTLIRCAASRRCHGASVCVCVFVCIATEVNYSRRGVARRCIRPHGCTHVRTIIMTLRVCTQLPFPVRKAEGANRKCENSYGLIFIELYLIVIVIIF